MSPCQIRIPGWVFGAPYFCTCQHSTCCSNRHWFCCLSLWPFYTGPLTLPWLLGEQLDHGLICPELGGAQKLCVKDWAAWV